MSERAQRVLYLDLVGGCAGDMLLAALLDLGVDQGAIEGALGQVGLEQVELEVHEVYPAGLRALRLDVKVRGVLADSHLREPDAGPDHGHSHDSGPEHVHEHDHDHSHHRPYRAIRERIENSSLPGAVKARALLAFARLAEAEAEAHGIAVDDVEFHEVGSDDAIADMVGVAQALLELGSPRVLVSPVPLGRGLTRGAHGPIPLPGPATLSLLKGAPLVQTELAGETVTPTGAALLMAFAEAFGPIPSMTLERIGVGAGHRDWPDRPNVVRAMLGTARESFATKTASECVIEANIDDMNPEHFAALERVLFDAGALDVWSTPVRMKKGRQGVLISALAPENLRPLLVEMFFEHSTTLGLRVSPVERHRAERKQIEVETEFGAVRVKIGARPSGDSLVMPEAEDCERIARARDVSIRTVFEAAQLAVWRRG